MTSITTENGKPSFLRVAADELKRRSSLSFAVFLFSSGLFGLSEPFEIYSAPQSLGMGNAITADAFGYAALYHNPAGLGVFTKKRWELNIIDLEGAIGGGAIGRAAAMQSLGMNRFFGDLKTHPGTYAHFGLASVPSFTVRNFGVSLLASHQFTGVSDGTNLDVLARQDVGAVVGYARQFAGNTLKLGIAVKALVRNEMKEVIPHTTLEADSDSSFARHFKEGYGAGADVGAMITLPNKWLPTFGVAWLDVMNTQFFSSTHMLNSQASGKPDNIPQSLNVAFSLHPFLGKGVKGTFAVEYKHLEITNTPWRKHFHVGMQIDTDRALYFWLGANKLYPTFGAAYRVTGGNFEVGTYAEEIGDGASLDSDRRYFFRYTIGF